MNADWQDWQGVHSIDRDATGNYTCDCGAIAGSERDVFTHILWATEQQRDALWGAGQRVCNKVTGAVEGLGRVLDLCRPNPRARAALRRGEGDMSDQAAREAAAKVFHRRRMDNTVDATNAAIDAYLAALRADGWRVLKVEPVTKGSIVAWHDGGYATSLREDGEVPWVRGFVITDEIGTT